MSALDLFPPSDDLQTPPAAQQGVLLTADVALRFMMAGKAIVTLKSLASGTHFTYRLGMMDNGNILVGLLNGPDNNANYKYMGLIRRGVYFHGRRTPRAGDIGPDAPAARAFVWSYGNIVKGFMPSSLQVLHEGRCGRCSRRLTHPDSIMSGFGPECIEMV